MELLSRLESVAWYETTSDRYVDARIVGIENRFQVPELRSQYIDWGKSTLELSEYFSLRDYGAS
jgi:hypothetical protein